MDGSRVGFLAQIVKGIWHPLPAQPEIEPICSDLVDSCFVHLILDSLVFPSNKVETEVAAELKAMTAQWAPGPCVLATVAFGGALLISRFMSAPGIKNVDAYLSERTWPNSPSLDASTMDPTASVASTTTPVTAGAMGSLASATSSVESNILASTTVSPQPIETEQEKRGRLGRKMIERLAICLDTISELMLSWIEMSPRVSHTENGGTMREDEVQRLLNLILTPAQRVTLASQWGFGHIQQTSLPARDGKNVALSSLLPTAATVEDPSFATVSTSSDVGTQSVDVASGISTADSLIPSGSSTSSASEQPVVASASPFNEVATSASNNAAGEGAPPRPILTPLDIPSPSTLLGQPSRISEQYHLPNLHSPISLLGYFRLLSDYYAGVVYDTEKKRRSDSSGEQILEGSTVGTYEGDVMHSRLIPVRQLQLRHLFSPTSSMNIEDLKTYEEAMRSNAAKPKKAPIRYGATYGLGPRGNHSAKNQVLMEWGTRAPESHLYRINIYAGDFLEQVRGEGFVLQAPRLFAHYPTRRTHYVDCGAKWSLVGWNPV
ncbi:hypothetical protein M427DRAFT_439086 [Gonapodya prolifera JEL478]|uniref:Uncharacterized protein n=1 Tax=Gonapodya prolifera (strain JEL478) TaxID=1344416 RepID=A0A139A4F1_GONPJ|nr:hypothetical protein M427DRAFT_439086 [Gonapodya prolifera JEL478]|eukprot:KXS11355.1 hypothetical protein M427DRAFT_439086 [Gonapodya prolifera JEL478]